MSWEPVLILGKRNEPFISWFASASNKPPSIILIWLCIRILSRIKLRKNYYNNPIQFLIKREFMSFLQNETFLKFDKTSGHLFKLNTSKAKRKRGERQF
jgi:hypothetical protein